MIKEPRVSEKVLSHRRALTCNFPDVALTQDDPMPQSMLEETAMIRDLHDARAELRTLCDMIQFFACPPTSDEVEPTALVSLSADILSKYGWVIFDATETQIQ